MDPKKLIAALGRMKVEIGSMVCFGCGHEHNCGVRGCALIRAAQETLSTLHAENENLRAELEQVKRERYVAIEYLREIEWCAGCKHFGGLDGCKKWIMGQCTEKHDFYEFVGPHKED